MLAIGGTDSSLLAPPGGEQRCGDHRNALMPPERVRAKAGDRGTGDVGAELVA